MSGPIRIAYADPVYLGMASRYSVPGTPEYHPEARKWDDPAEHGALMERLDREYPDGWAFSLSSTTLRVLLPMAPERARVMAWVKPFVSFKPGVWPIYAWEPVLVAASPRKGAKTSRRPRDFVSASVGHGHTAPFFGAKPPAFWLWLFDVFALGEHPDDVFVDVFPGSGSGDRAWDAFRGRPVKHVAEVQAGLFCGAEREGA